ncbi:uncharacterized protein LOC134822448 isoform X2 [Bolinopsis microptera]
MSQADPTASTSILHADTPSWSEIDGILSDKYRSESDPGPEPAPIATQSTQETVIQQPLTSQTSPMLAYYSQPQFRERSFEDGTPLISSLPSRIANVEMSTPPRRSSSSEASFGSSQRERIARLRRELLDEEERVMAKSEKLALSMRDHAESALGEPQPSASVTTLHLDSSQQLSHSIFDEQSRARLKIAKPPSIPSDPGFAVNSVSVDITPLTEDLLMNSRLENGQSVSDGGQTISDGQFPYDDDDIIFTPLSDDDFANAFATPPRVQRKLDKKVHRPTPKRSKVQLQSHGKVIGTTELGSFDETSSLSIIDKDNLLSRFKDSVKPLRRHAWSDSETENSLSKSLNKHQFSEVNSKQEQLPSHAERVLPELPSAEDRPRSAFAVLSPHEGKYRPLTAPSSEKVLKFDVPYSTRFLSEPQIVEQKTSETSLDTNDYPNLHSSFVSLQNTIMSDIAALRREIVDKQEGTEKLRSEFSDFKHAYYRSVVEGQVKTKQLQDAKIQTSQITTENKENAVHPPRVAIEHKDTSYSECDSETDRQLATLKALQRSLREQSNERYLRDLEERIDAKAAKTAATLSAPPSVDKVDRMQQSSPAHLSNRAIQTAPIKVKTTADANCNTSDVEASRPKIRGGRNSSKAASSEHVRAKSNSEVDSRPKSPYQVKSKVELPAPSPKPATQQVESGDSSLDSTEVATRDLFMEILRKKAEMDENEQERKSRQEENHISTKDKQTSANDLPSSTPKPGLKAGKSTFTSASMVSGDSTLTEGTVVVEEDVEALNALWSEFMKFVVQSRALKQHKSRSASRREPCIQVDVKKLEKMHKSFNQETYRKGVNNQAAKKKNRPSGKVKGRKAVEKKAPEVFELSAGELKHPRKANLDETCTNRSMDSRQNRIDRLIREIEEERRKRVEEREEKIKEKEELIPIELDSFPVRDHEEIKMPSPAPTSPAAPVKQRVKSPVAFEISLDQESVTSEDVDRAPGYPNMVFKTGKLQDAFHAYKQRFIKQSRRRALSIQLCKEAREKYATSTPPVRPRPTIDARYFASFDIPPPAPKNRIISHKVMTRNSKKLYNRLEEVQKKKKDTKVQRERETYRLRAQLFNKRVQDTVLNKKYISSVRAY